MKGASHEGRKPGRSALRVCTVPAAQVDGLSLHTRGSAWEGARPARAPCIPAIPAKVHFWLVKLVLVEGESRLYSMGCRVAGGTLPAVAPSLYTLR